MQESSVWIELVKGIPSVVTAITAIVGVVIGARIRIFEKQLSCFLSTFARSVQRDVWINAQRQGATLTSEAIV